jgi:hypothetical protein
MITLLPSGDKTGATDTANIKAAWDAGERPVVLNGGEFHIKGLRWHGDSDDADSTPRLQGA